jgi:hypothetical protein
MSDCIVSSDRPRNLRSKSTNDLFKVSGLHEQSEAGRRYGDLVRSFVAALGGEAALNEHQRMAVRRAGELVTAAEMERAKMLRGEPVDPLALIRLDNSAARAVKALAIKPSVPPVKTLAEHLAERAAERAGASSEAPP